MYFTNEEIEERKLSDKNAMDSDNLTVKTRAISAIVHNHTVDYFESNEIPYIIIAQNYFKFIAFGTEFFFYAKSKKWKMVRGPTSHVMYRSNGIEGVLQCLKAKRGLK